MSVKPTISYGHGFVDDCTNATLANWDKAEAGLTGALSVVNDDSFDFVCAGAGGYVVWTNHTALGLSTTVFTKFRVRYKVISGSGTVSIYLQFSDTTSQTIVAAGASAVWKTIVAVITSGKTLNYIHIQGNGSSIEFQVDFLLIYKSDFTIPNTGMLAHFSVAGRLPILEPVSALGDTIQNLGVHSAVVEMHCNLDIGTWTRAGDLLPGQVFLDIIQASMTEPFQWITLGVQQAQFKVLLETPDFQYAASESKASHNLLLTFREYRRAPANSETAVERFGLT